MPSVQYRYNILHQLQSIMPQLYNVDRLIGTIRIAVLKVETTAICSYQLLYVLPRPLPSLSSPSKKASCYDLSIRPGPISSNTESFPDPRENQSTLRTIRNQQTQVFKCNRGVTILNAVYCCIRSVIFCCKEQQYLQ